jgi:hypothetical protein
MSSSTVPLLSYLMALLNQSPVFLVWLVTGILALVF